MFAAILYISERTIGAALVHYISSSIVPLLGHPYVFEGIFGSLSFPKRISCSKKGLERRKLTAELQTGCILHEAFGTQCSVKYMIAQDTRSKTRRIWEGGGCFRDPGTSTAEQAILIETMSFTLLWVSHLQTARVHAK